MRRRGFLATLGFGAVTAAVGSKAKATPLPVHRDDVSTPSSEGTPTYTDDEGEDYALRWSGERWEEADVQDLPIFADGSGQPTIVLRKAEDCTATIRISGEDRAVALSGSDDAGWWEGWWEG